MGRYSEYEIFGRGKILEGGLDVCSRTSSWGVGLEGPVTTTCRCGSGYWLKLAHILLTQTG